MGHDKQCLLNAMVFSGSPRHWHSHQRLRLGLLIKKLVPSSPTTRTLSPLCNYYLIHLLLLQLFIALTVTRKHLSDSSCFDCDSSSAFSEHTEMKPRCGDEFVAFVASLSEFPLISDSTPGDNLWCSWRCLEPSAQHCQSLHFQRTPPASRLQREIPRKQN